MKRILSIVTVLMMTTSLAIGCASTDDDGGDTDVAAVEEEMDGEDSGAEGDTEGEAEDDMEGDAETDAEPEMDGTDVFAFEAAASGGTLVIGQQQEPDTLYTYGGSMLAGSHVLNSIYDGPIEGLDYDYQAVILEQLPKLENGGAVMDMVSVEAGEQYVDSETQEVVTATETIEDLPQLTVTFTLKDGLTWQDGTAVSAEDSVFSRSLACHPDTPTSKYTCDRTVSYEADGNSTVWTGLPGFTDQTYFTNFYTPLPRHQPSSDGETTMADMEPTTILEDEEFTRKPYSYGPFKIDEWESGAKIVLEKNENYWRADEGLPFLDSVIHQFIPDTNALLAAMTSGEIDVGTQGGLGLDQFEALSAAEDAGEITPYYVVGTVWEHIDFNLDPIDERVPLGACLGVRQAIAYGTDRQNMVDVIQKGKTKVQNTYIPEDHWAYPPADSLTVYDYDPETAMTLLDDLGFVDGDGDGIREAAEDITCTITTDIDGNTKDQVIPAGTTLGLTLNTTEGNQMREETTLLFQQNMRDIGVDVTLEYLAANIYFEDGPDGPLFGRRFDLGEFAWLTGVQPPVGLYWCTEIPNEDNAWAGQNETGWCDPEYDKISKQADATLERAEALPLYHQAQQMFTDNLPVMPLFARVKVMATTPDVVNFKPNATVNSETWNVETWGFADTATE